MKKTLRIFSLNTEYGKYSDTLIPYIQNISKEVDVFCLQEVPRNAKNTICFESWWYDDHLFEKLEKALPDFTPYYVEFLRESYGIVTFVKSELRQKSRWETYIYHHTDEAFLDRGRWNSATKAMCIKVEWIHIVSLHGAWQPKSKKQDTPERLIQSKILRKFTKWREPKTVLIWDFNLMPDTESVRILEKKYINLIKKYGISCTRTSVYDDPSLPFADYAFVGEDIHVHDFQVHLDPIFSDHGFMTLSISRD